MAKTVTITATKDAYVDTSNNRWYGTESILKIGADIDRHAFQYGCIIYFPVLENIPLHAKIINATLNINISTAKYYYANRYMEIRYGNMRNNIHWEESNIPSNIQEESIKTGGTSEWIHEKGNYSLDMKKVLTPIVEGKETNNSFCFARGNMDDARDYIYIKSVQSDSKPYLNVTYEEVPPTKPSNVKPNDENKRSNEKVIFSWSYTPQYEGDTQYKYELQYSIDNGQNWRKVSKTTSSTSYTLPANTFIYDTDIIWKVRVYNKQLLMSQWAESRFHLIGKPHTPVITNSTTLNTPKLSITWSSKGQVSYKIKILDGTKTLLDTKEIVGTQKFYRVSRTLENNKKYTIRLAIKNKYGNWSSEATKTITTNYPEPEKPELIINSNNVMGTITIKCIKKDGVLPTHHFQVFRKDDQEQYIKIADNIKSTYTDYTVKSGKTYYYKIRAIAEEGQYKDSTEASKAAFVKGSQIALTSDYSNGINLRYNRTLQVKYQLNRQTTNFDGREKPVVEYGEHLSKYFSIGFLIRDNEDIQKIEEILTANETILYRDDRGRKIYGTITQIDIDDDRRLKYNLTFILQEVDFSEVL
ncbi:hypothetical protein SH1V18_14880 [Vallitalea longa]|uniref:Fibronectin type-III domain-containing protein n=1 Tax=Vallitalea longa TaxID=2936439 RepID=A0A9W5YD30_9FIRM|nr:DNRLRE domain-containing protein [Vallitalea longa]GKX29008.1 hypothetical protein SH1V18_14880 [Vallitalea longa]